MKLATIKTALVALALVATTAFANASSDYWLNAGEQFTWYGTFASGSYELTVEGDGEGDIDVYVFGQLGDLIACDESTEDGAVLDFDVPWMQQVSIVLVNNGQEDSLYDIFVD